jgi:hypothetical protein
LDERDHQPAEQPATAAAKGPQIVEALDELDYQQARGTKRKPSLAAAIPQQQVQPTAAAAAAAAAVATRNFTRNLRHL